LEYKFLNVAGNNDDRASAFLVAITQIWSPNFFKSVSLIGLHVLHRGWYAEFVLGINHKLFGENRSKTKL
jgi:hypothetical protein